MSEIAWIKGLLDMAHTIRKSAYANVGAHAGATYRALDAVALQTRALDRTIRVLEMSLLDEVKKGWRTEGGANKNNRPWGSDCENA